MNINTYSYLIRNIRTIKVIAILNCIDRQKAYFILIFFCFSIHLFSQINVNQHDSILRFDIYYSDTIYAEEIDELHNLKNNSYDCQTIRAYIENQKNSFSYDVELCRLLVKQSDKEQCLSQILDLLINYYRRNLNEILLNPHYGTNNTYIFYTEYCYPMYLALDETTLQNVAIHFLESSVMEKKSKLALDKQQQFIISRILNKIPNEINKLDHDSSKYKHIMELMKFK